MKKLIILLAFILPLLSTAQKTNVKNIYLDNNDMITYSILVDSLPRNSSIDHLYCQYADSLSKDVSVELHYPMFGTTDVTRENGQYRITVYQIYFYTGALALPIESFAVQRNKLTKNSKRLISVIAFRDFLNNYFTSKN